MLEEEETPPQFSEDERVEFIGMRICQMLNMNTVSWNKFVTVEENQRLLTDYFEKQVKLLFFIPAAPTVLTASTEVSVHLNECLIYPSGMYMCNVSMFYVKVCLPLLSNKKNHLLWPNVISQDVTQHIESLSNKVSVVKGQVYGKTVLPVPAVAGKTEDSLERTAVHAVESMVINWTRLIQKVLKEDSADLILKGLNPEPMTELDFWRSRKKNIENIYEQVCSKMVRILEVADSSYYPCFKTVTEELRPLLLQVQEGEFSSIRMFIRPLFHLVFLVWTHCTSYRMPARLVVLLQELANLLIQQASSYLGAEELLRGETEETLEKLQIVVKLLRCFKDTYHTYREKVTAWASAKGIHKWWDFPSALVFTRFNCFLARVLMLEDLFSTMLELQNLEKLIFGGTKGRMYTEQVSLLHSEFQQLCKKIRDCYSCVNHFEQDYAHFKQTVTDYDRRLGSILCLAYKDCSGLESIFKVSYINNGLQKQKIEMFAPNFTKLIHHFGVELERCKHLFNSYLEQKGKAMLCKNMPAMSGAMKWAKMMRDRIQIPWENFRFVLDM
uniref:Dynein heavy chain tail domain-containing protein n=1 Tax=Electrophorus electricus TaxID=8005 RepID=A0AAY5EZT2_ELEEL